MATSLSLALSLALALEAWSSTCVSSGSPCGDLVGPMVGMTFGRGLISVEIRGRLATVTRPSIFLLFPSVVCFS